MRLHGDINHLLKSGKTQGYGGTPSYFAVQKVIEAQQKSFFSLDYEAVDEASSSPS